MLDELLLKHAENLQEQISTATQVAVHCGRPTNGVEGCEDAQWNPWTNVTSKAGAIDVGEPALGATSKKKSIHAI